MIWSAERVAGTARLLVLERGVWSSCALSLWDSEDEPSGELESDCVAPGDRGEEEEDEGEEEEEEDGEIPWACVGCVNRSATTSRNAAIAA